MAQVGGALRARLGRGGGGARGQRQRRQEQPQRARARTHGAPRPWQPPGRRHCTTPRLIPRTTTRPDPPITLAVISLLAISSVDTHHTQHPHVSFYCTVSFATLGFSVYAVETIRPDCSHDL